MRSPLLAALLLAAALGALAAALWLAAPESWGASSLSRGPSGWLVARRYLEERGDPVALLDRPAGRLEELGVPRGTPLVVTFPRLPSSGGEPEVELRELLTEGHTVVVAYGGWMSDTDEQRLLAELGLTVVRVREDPPLGPAAWRRYWLEERRLEANEPGAAALHVPTPELAPRPPAASETLFSDPRGPVSVFEVTRGKGRLVVLPAAALANAHIRDNVHLLEALRARLGTGATGWVFDEFHHGYKSPDAGPAVRTGGSMRPFVWQLLLLYALAVWVLARRFVRPWPAEPVRLGGTTDFLMGLGALHHRLGHHAEAAAQLVDHVTALEPRLRLPSDTADRAASVTGGRGLVTFANHLQTLRRSKGEST